PTGLWEKIAASVASEPGGAHAEAPEPPALPPPVTGVVSIHRAPAGAPAPPAQAPPAQAVPAPAPAPLRPRAGRRLASLVSVVAIAAAALVVLGIEVGRLHSQVQTLKSQVAAQDLKGSEVAANAAPHVTVDLALANRQPAATVVVTPSGGAYWEWSSLRNLPASQTYQLWGLVRGKPVSLALVGAKPDTISFFRLQPQATVLMVTAEPEGGVPSPTTPVLAQGAVPPSALS
ncbi:MAG TPA: anti-sigma factor, partial [Acidimicrobiales bacterium]|nr:anti-sigma factor [Acidimicrobiales bacterium]